MLLALALPCSGVLFEVPDDFATIGEALYYSGLGDTVLVHPGIYRERLILPGHDFLLASEFYFTHDSSAIDSTIIDASDFAEEDTASVLTFFNGNSRATVVAGFTLRGGHGFRYESGNTGGGAIYVRDSHPTILSNIITENESWSSVAVCAYYSHPRIAYNHIYGNCGRNYIVFIGYYADLNSETVFEWNDIGQNHCCEGSEWWPYLASPGLYVIQSGAVIRFNRFHDYATYDGTMVVDFYNAWGELWGNCFENLRYDDSYPESTCRVVDSYYSRVSVRDNLLKDCLVNRPAVYIQNHCQAAPTVIERNWFENIRNIGEVAAALYVLEPRGTIRENIFIQCVGEWIGAIALFFAELGTAGCRATIEENHFIANRYLREGQYRPNASAISANGTGSSLCTVRNNWFEGNDKIAIDLEHYPNPLDWDCRENYWGDPSGPYHPARNPEGRGDTVGDHVLFDPWLTSPPTGSGAPSSPFALSPQDWKLEGAFPNPFNESTRIQLLSSRPQPLEMTVYNLLGQRVRRLWQGIVPKDTPVSVTWDGRDEYGQAVATGLYFVVANSRYPASSQFKTCKILCLR